MRSPVFGLSIRIEHLITPSAPPLFAPVQCADANDVSKEGVCIPQKVGALGLRLVSIFFFFLMYKNLILTTNCVNLSCYEKFNIGNCVFVKRFDERHDECSSGHKRLHERSSDWH